MARDKKILTIGEVAQICDVAPRTVRKWFDIGILHGFKLPGSNDRRVPRVELERFMKENNMPVELLMSDP